MLKSEEYRRNAAACAELAMTVSDPEARLALGAMAASWLRLADFVDLSRPNEKAEVGGPDGGSGNEQE